MDKGSPKESFVLGFECANTAGREMLEQVLIELLGTNGTRDFVWTWGGCEYKGKLRALNQHDGLKGNMVYFVCVRPNFLASVQYALTEIRVKHATRWNSNCEECNTRTVVFGMAGAKPQWCSSCVVRSHPDAIDLRISMMCVECKSNRKLWG